MKYLVRSSILISIYYLTTLPCIIDLKAQDWPCGPSASNNISIRGDLNLSENSVAVHPLYPNIILSANNQNYPAQVTAFTSTDWGNTWYPETGNGVIDEHSCCDPSAAIDLNGWLYVAYVGGGIKVARSTNLGNNWSIFTVSSHSNDDKDHLKVDNSCNSSYKGRLYCAWTVGGTIKASYSSNSGNNWSSPATLSSSGFGLGVNIATDNSGVVYVVWAIHDGSNNWNKLQFTKSTNGGNNWSNPSTINLTYIVNRYTGGYGPSMTVNMQDNTLYLVYSGRVDQSGPFYNDVFMKKSTDGGANWSAESRVNLVQLGSQTFPWISCDPMTNYLACIYYDTRTQGQKNVYVSMSTNSGTNWCDMKVNTIAVGQATGTGSDYIGIEFNKGIISPVWTRSVFPEYRTQIYPYEVMAKDLIIQNQAYSGNQLIQSANTITASNVTINSRANVTFRTVRSITLLPGFYTNDNSYFSAELFRCDAYLETENIVQNNPVKPEEKDNAPFEFSLSQNYPNPFNPVTIIKYSLKQDSWVTITVYNILGQEVKRLIDGYEYAGYRSVVWDGTNEYGSNVSSGIYFCKLTAGDFIDRKKMVIVR